MGLRYVDVTGDGINELIVLSMKGVHFLQVFTRMFGVTRGIR